MRAHVDDHVDLGERLGDVGIGGQGVDRVRFIEKQDANLTFARHGEQCIELCPAMNGRAVAIEGHAGTDRTERRVDEVGGSGELCRAGRAARQCHTIVGHQTSTELGQCLGRNARCRGCCLKGRIANERRDVRGATLTRDVASDRASHEDLCSRLRAIEVIAVHTCLVAVWCDQAEPCNTVPVVRVACLAVEIFEVGCAPAREEWRAEGQHVTTGIEVVVRERRRSEHLTRGNCLGLVAKRLPEHGVAVGIVGDEVDERARAVSAEVRHRLAGRARSLDRTSERLEACLPCHLGAVAGRPLEAVRAIVPLQLKEGGGRDRRSPWGTGISADIHHPTVTVPSKHGLCVWPSRHGCGEEGWSAGHYLVGLDHVGQHILHWREILVVIESTRGESPRAARHTQRL